jgi:large repetitive protein
MKTRETLRFQAVVGLMIGLNVHIGFVQASPLYAIETAAPRWPSPLTAQASGPDPAASANTEAGDEGVNPLGPSKDPPVARPDSVGWLDPTVDANFNDRSIQELLDKLGLGVTNAFAFVRDQVGYEAYEGSLRGARGTLWSQAGNSLDQASLLIALLRGQGIAAQYARGTLSDTDAQALIASLFDPVVVANAVGYVPERFPRADPVHDPTLLAEVRGHWWVELTNGAALDPSFKDSVVGTVRGKKTANYFEVPEELRHKVVVRLKAEFHNMLSQYTEQMPLEVTFSTPEVYGKPLTLGHFIGAYQPPSMFIGYQTYTYSPYLMVDDNDDSLDNDELIRGTDYQEFFSGSFPIANMTLTRVTLEFEVRDPGKEPTLHSRDLLDRVGYAARHGLAQPGPVDTTKPALTEYDLAAVLIMPGLLDWRGIEPLQDDFKRLSTESESLAPQAEILSQRDPTTLTAEENEVVAHYARLTQSIQKLGMAVTVGMFLHDSDYYLQMMRRSHLTAAYYDSPRLILTTSRLRFGSEPGEARLTVGLDLRRNRLRAIPYPGQNAFSGLFCSLAKSFADSKLEQETAKLALGGPAPENRMVPSAGAVWEAVAAQKVPVVLLTREAEVLTRLQGLDLSAEAKARITEALSQGKVVNLPAHAVEVDGVLAIAWYEIDLTTGEVASVTEDGGHQEAIEFILITVLIGIAGILAETLLGGNIQNLFKGTTKTATSKPFAVNNPQTDAPLQIRAGSLGGDTGQSSLPLRRRKVHDRFWDLRDQRRP